MAAPYVPSLRKLDEAIEQHISEAHGALSTLSRVFGPIKFGRRFALTLDPLLRFSMSDKKIAPRNRVRRATIALSGVGVWFNIHTKVWTKSKPTTLLSPNPPVNESSSDSTSASILDGYWAGSSTPDVINDTCKSKRPVGQNDGEMDYTRFVTPLIPRKTPWKSNIYENILEVFPGGFQWTRSETERTVNVWPSAGYLSTTDLSSLRSSETAALNTLVSKNGMRLLSSALPNKREMNLLRSLVELRDLPKTIKQSIEFFSNSHLWDKPISKIANDYVNLEFGIKPILDDIKKLLELPRTLPARVAALQARYLKDTTYHSGFSIIEHGGSTAFKIPYHPTYETNLSIGTKNVRKIQLRATVNANVRFPDMLVGLPPEFAWIRIMGLDPTLSDVYKLIPWTWLVDWFWDFGDYLSTVCEFNSDPSVINYGLLTAKSVNTLVTVRNLSHRCQRQVGQGIYTTITNEDSVLAVTVVGELRSYLRISAVNLPKVPCTSTMTGLSLWQSSILGALIAAKFTK